MAQVNAKCTLCGSEVVIDSEKDAVICPVCQNPFVTEKAISLYNGEHTEEIKEKKKRHIWKSLGRACLCALECIGYLIYVLSFMWLFFDITDVLKKK